MAEKKTAQQREKLLNTEEKLLSRAGMCIPSYISTVHREVKISIGASHPPTRSHVGLLTFSPSSAEYGICRGEAQ